MRLPTNESKGNVEEERNEVEKTGGCCVREGTVQCLPRDC